MTANPKRRRPQLDAVCAVADGGSERAGLRFGQRSDCQVFDAFPLLLTHLQSLITHLLCEMGSQGADAKSPPPNSRNTCGYFSPDGYSLLFASTAGKEDPEEPSSGYQRQGGNYRWSYPKGMEVFRAEFDATHDRIDFVQRRNHDDRDMAQFVVGFEPFQHLIPIHHRHHNVEQHQVEPPRPHGLHRERPVFGRYHAVPLPLQTP